jgi:DNA topoisomerase-2
MQYNFLEPQESEYGIKYDPNLEKTVSDTNDASSYGYIPEIPRIFLRSHIYGGSHTRDERVVFIFNSTSNIFEKRKITTPKLQERTYIEILSNALDNAFKSFRMGVPFPQLEITMILDTISIKSGGVPIPIDLHEYFYSQGDFGTCAELIFGVVGAGGNTDDSKAKQSAGVNGVGSKLTNAFSRIFEVEIGDNIRGFHQKITWRKNMMVKESSIITPSDFKIFQKYNEETRKMEQHISPNSNPYTGENFVRVTWKQDFRKFGVANFTQDELDLYMKYACETSFIGKIVLKFNDKILDYRSSHSYISLYPKEFSKTSLIHYEFSQAPTFRGKELENAIINLQISPIIELIILDTPGEGMHISYCNGIYNVDGGVHTNAAYHAILDAVKINIQGVKGFDKSLDLSKINIGHLKKDCTIILSFRTNDPLFKTQDKEQLMKPTPKISLSPEEITKMKKWNLINSLYITLTGKHLSTSSKESARERIRNDENFEDANWVGTKNGNQTIMIFCEGKSAGSYVLKWILATPERKNKYAVLLLRGKFKNVTDVGPIEMESNPEIKKIIQYMGLRYDADYTTKKDLDTLRYPTGFIMVDADTDGSHIQSLLMNFFHRAFPTFLIARRLFYVQTPVIRLLTSSGKTKTIFYNMFDYHTWVKDNNGIKHEAKYFKGLASGKDTFAKEDSNCSPIVSLTFDQIAAQAFDTAFKKGLTNDRKKWITFWRNKIDLNVVQGLSPSNPRYGFINVSDYLNTKLVEYSIDSFSRALPSYKDGLKKSQRQLIWYILEEFNFGTKRKEVNIESIAQSAKAESKYCHGDLAETLVRMAQDYPGANNLPLMAQEGQFGTRNKLGKDVGAGRYIETKPEWFVSKIFNKELMNLIERVVVQDKEVEPKWIPCKIPLHIINGVLGLATAYSLFIPSYHPVDIILWILQYIKGQKVFPLIPWFKGFTGLVELEIFKSKNVKSKEFLIEGQDCVEYYEGLTLSTIGNYKIVKKRNKEYTEEVNGKKIKVMHEVSDIFISEIPIGVALAKYRSIMEGKCDNIDDQMETTDSPCMTLEGWKTDISLKSLGLIDRVGMCNITLIDDESFPKQFRNVYEALKLYCDNMISLYLKLKETRLKNLEEYIKDTEIIIKLIELLLADKINTKRQKKSYIEQQLIPHGIEMKYYNKLPRDSESEEGYNEYYNKLEKLKEDYKKIYETHHLEEWNSDLISLKSDLDGIKEYKKLKHHEYPFVPTEITNLLNGKVKSPFVVKEEEIPESI